MGINAETDEKYSQAENYIREGKELFAVQIYKQLLDEKKEVRSTLLRLASLYEKLRLYDKVSELIEKFLTENDDPEIAALYGQFLMRTKNFSRAVQVFERINKISRPEVYYFCGVARYELSDSAAAYESFKKYLDSKEKRYRDKALFASALSAFKMKNYDLALENLDKLNNVNLPREKQTAIYLLYAKIYYKQNLFYYAREAVEKTLKQNKEYDEETFLLAGKIHFNLGEYDKAENYLTAILNSGVKTSEIFSLLGFIEISKNNISESQKLLAKALEINPFDKKTILLKEKLLSLLEINSEKN